MKVLTSLLNIISKGNSRTVLMKKNILGSFIIRGWNCIVQLLLVPVTLNCLTQYEYGIWLTINGILLWMDSFDVGLGNGLRNQLTKAIAAKDYTRGRILVSTTFTTLCIIILPVIILLLLLVNKADCYSFFNVDYRLVPNLKGILMITIAIVGATFVLKIIGNIYLALQMPAINNLIVAIGQTLSFVIIAILSFTNANTKLIDVAIIYALSPLITYLCFYPITFIKYNFLRPSIKLFDRNELKPLFGLGIKFFFIQISAMIIFTTSNIIISQLFSPDKVTPFQIAYRYFCFTNIIFTLLSVPLWSATTDAYAKNDWKWILSVKKKMNYILYTFFLVILLMLFVAKPIYQIWTGSKIEVPWGLSASMAVYMILVLYGTCYSNMLCGFGKVKLLTIVSVFQACLFLPLAIFMGKCLELPGIVYALIITTAISAITNKIQCELICSNKAHGIFNK